MIQSDENCSSVVSWGVVNEFRYLQRVKVVHTNYTKTKDDKSQKNSRCHYRGDMDETIDHKISEFSMLAPQLRYLLIRERNCFNRNYKLVWTNPKTHSDIRLDHPIQENLPNYGVRVNMNQLNTGWDRVNVNVCNKVAKSQEFARELRKLRSKKNKILFIIVCIVWTVKTLEIIGRNVVVQTLSFLSLVKGSLDMRKLTLS